ncbi:MAG: hypothetical protein M1326_00080 [Cyanobacteria bacterium]|nr:hypothetical protein [Cyanobacteriota bacterium]
MFFVILIELGYFVYRSNVQNTKPIPVVNSTLSSQTNNCAEDPVASFMSTYTPMQDMQITMNVNIKERITQLISYNPFDIKYDFATNPNEKNLRFTLPNNLTDKISFFIQDGNSKKSIDAKEIKSGDMIMQSMYFNPLLKPNNTNYIQRIEIIKVPNI